jgi:hypothetical protein
MAARARALIDAILEEFGGDAPPAYNLDDPSGHGYVEDAQLMLTMEKILTECQLSFTTFIVGEESDD